MLSRKDSWCCRGSVELITVSKNYGLYERELKRCHKDTYLDVQKRAD